MAPDAFFAQDFADFAAALDERVLRPRKRRRALTVRIHHDQGNASAARVVLDALELRYRSDGAHALVPYAKVADWADPAEAIVRELERNTPPGWGTLRFPRYGLLKSLTDDAEPPDEAGNRAFAHRRPGLAGAAEHSKAVILDRAPRILQFPVTVGLLVAKRWFIRRWRRRSQEPWFTGPPDTRTSEFFGRARELMRDGERAPQVRLAALLADLDEAFRPVLSPWRRRRRSGFVMLLDRPPAAMAGLFTGGRHRHVTAIMTAEAEPGTTYRTFAQTANDLQHRDVADHHVSAGGIPAGAAPGDLAAPGSISAPTGSDLAARVEAGGYAGVAVAGVLLLAIYLLRPPQEPPAAADHTCAGGAKRSTDTRVRPVPPPEELRGLYEQDKQAIAEKNRIAEEKERQDYTVKTIVYLGSGVGAANFEEPQFNGVIPELRGIRLAQQRLNQLADADPRSRDNLDGNVYIRIDVREAGRHFADAPRIAREVAEQSGQKVLGVIGLGESRTETLEAQKILGDGGLPMLGMGATSEHLQDNPLYRQVSWDNPRQALLAADFVRRANVIARQAGGCEPAKRAVIIGDPGDDYSQTLSQDFAKEFPNSEQIWFGDGPRLPGRVAGSLADLADLACRSLARDPRHTLVYWPGRAAMLKDFLDAAKGNGSCPAAYTVVTGADVNTTVTRAEAFAQAYPGVRLYHSAHALPTEAPNVIGGDFRRAYADLYPSLDAWHDHWRGPVAYDGTLTMAQAINAACRENRQAGCGRGSLQSQMARGAGGSVGVLGATGTIAFEQGPSQQANPVPAGKRFLMLYDTGGAPAVVMECGRRDRHDVRTHWGAGRRFPCPKT